MLIWSIVESADAEIVRTSEEAVREAVVLLIAELEELRARDNNRVRTWFVGAGVGAGTILLLWLFSGLQGG